MSVLLWDSYWNLVLTICVDCVCCLKRVRLLPLQVKREGPNNRATSIITWIHPSTSESEWKYVVCQWDKAHRTTTVIHYYSHKWLLAPIHSQGWRSQHQSLLELSPPILIGSLTISPHHPRGQDSNMYPLKRAIYKPQHSLWWGSKGKPSADDGVRKYLPSS